MSTPSAKRKLSSPPPPPPPPPEANAEIPFEWVDDKEWKAIENPIPVQWVDDDEWKAIERAFDALPKPRLHEPLRQEQQQQQQQLCPAPRISSSMVPSILPPPAPPVPSRYLFSPHQACPNSTNRRALNPNSQAGPESLRQRDHFFCAAAVCPNSHGDGGGTPWKKTAGVPTQSPTWNVLPGGSGAIRSQSARGSEFTSNDSIGSESHSNDSRSEQERRGSEPVEHNFLPSVLNPEQLVGPGQGTSDPFLQLSEVTGPNVEVGNREEVRKVAGRRLPAWVEPAGRFLLSMNGSRSLEGVRGVSGGAGGGSDVEKVEEGVEKSSRRAHDERVQIVGIAQPQQKENGYPSWFRLGQPLVGTQWGLQPSGCVEDVKCKFPSMQFRGQIVYSKTESEVNAATDELWRRVRETQATAQGAIPIGFDLEWRPTFDKGEVQRKVAVMQLCLDGSRCDVMHIIYSGIPPSLQNLLEAPSTVKVGVGIFGDVSRLRNDYQIATRKIIDLRNIANEKMQNMKQWSLSSLAVQLTGKQIDKVRNIRCGDWEALPLSEPQLQYAATDAFASLHLYQVLTSFSSPPAEERNQNGSADSRTNQQPPIT